MGTNNYRVSAPIAMTLCTAILLATCLLNVGCKSMKGNFSKMAFWKKEKPPISELASRSGASLAPPSQTAAVLEGTLGPDGKGNSPTSRAPYGKAPESAGAQSYAQTDTGSAPAASAYGRTNPYAKNPSDAAPQSVADRGQIDPYAPAGKGTAGKTALASFDNSSKGFAAPSSSSNPYMKSNSNPSGSSNLNGSFSSAGRAAIDAGKTKASSSSQVASAGQYPSTKFGSFSPAATNAGLETSNSQYSFGNVSQASSTVPLNPQPALNANNHSSNSASNLGIPVAALARQGSYAPGSTGASLSDAYSGGFRNAAENAGCQEGCGCSGCRTASAAGSESRGGSFMK